MATTERRLDTSPDAPTDDAGEPLETMTAWCSHHDLIHALLPFECRRTDSFAEFETLAAALDELPATAATFRLGDLETPEGERPVKYRPTGSGVVTTQLHLLGAWEFAETSCGWRWINPNYIHDHPWQSSQCDADEREAILRHAARLGAVTRADVAPRFGVTKKGVEKWIRRHDIPWKEWRATGLRRLTRTLLTVRAWSDRSLPAVADPLPSPNGTVKSWVQRYARDEAWSPPADPSQYHGFQNGGGVDCESETQRRRGAVSAARWNTEADGARTLRVGRYGAHRRHDCGESTCFDSRRASRSRRRRPVFLPAARQRHRADNPVASPLGTRCRPCSR